MTRTIFEGSRWAADFRKSHPEEDFRDRTFGDPSLYVALRSDEGGVLHDQMRGSLTSLRELLRQLPHPHRASFFESLSVEAVELPSLRQAVTSELDKLTGICREAVSLQAHFAPVVNGNWDAKVLRENLVRSLESQVLTQAGRVL